jgi:hypothetical protein
MASLVLYNRKTQSFQDHVGVMICLLNRYLAAAQVTDTKIEREKDLTAYVVLKSSPRMFYRFHRSDSFREALKSINPTQLTDFPFPKRRELTTSQVTRDRNFLKVLKDPIINAYLDQSDEPKPDISTLQSMSLGSDHLTFYTALTGLEIHRLLLFLLTDFSLLLTILNQFAQCSVESFSTITGLRGDANKEFLIAYSRRLAICGNLLRFLIYSSAMEAHIVRFHQLLIPQVSLAPDGEPEPDADADNDIDDDIDEEVDDDGEQNEKDYPEISGDSRSSSGGQTVLPTEVVSCMRWLRLQVCYFEAVRTLCRAADKLSSSKPTTLSIKIVAANFEESRMKPWEALVTELFPGSPSMAADAICAVKSLKKSEFPKLPIGEYFRGTIHCEACLGSLMNNHGMTDELTKEFEAGGLFLSTVPYPHTTTQGVNRTFIGVSKRCCPVCTQLLDILFPQQAERLHLVGSHRTIYPCSLPPWMPVDVVQKMVDIFGAMLREILQELTEPGKGRTSGDSAGFSPGTSLESDIEPKLMTAYAPQTFLSKREPPSQTNLSTIAKKIFTGFWNRKAKK